MKAAVEELIKLLKWLVPWAVLLFVAWRIWPTPYEYQRLGPNTVSHLRIERATGRVWVSSPQGWRLIVPAKEAQP